MSSIWRTIQKRCSERSFLADAISSIPGPSSCERERWANVNISEIKMSYNTITTHFVFLGSSASSSQYKIRGRKEEEN